MIGRPPVILETTEAPFGRGPSAEINKYSLRPLVEWVERTQTTPSLTGASGPEMFSVGPLPVFTASGVDVDVLRWCHWRARHTAAMTTDLALVWAIVEASAEEGGDPAGLRTTPEGERAWRDYVGRVWRWATAPAPADEMPVSEKDYAAFRGGRE